MLTQQHPGRPAHPTLTRVRGVTRRKDGSFQAAICVSGAVKHLGRFKTQEEAAEAYRAACERIGREVKDRPQESHGLSRTKMYRRWRSMLCRCNCPSHNSFKRYGAKGIKVCERWLVFETFVSDMGSPPTADHTLERIDGTKGYEPGNVTWATPMEQARNRCTNNFIEFRGERLTVTDWANRLGTDVTCIRNRLRAGWTVEESLTTPPNRKNRKGNPAA